MHFTMRMFLLFGVCHALENPNWFGKFNMDDSCEQADCCCLAGEVTISQGENNFLRVVSGVAGAPCQKQLNGSNTIDVSLPNPTGKQGFQLIIPFLGTTNRFTLTYNSRYIANVNFDEPKCSGMAWRSDQTSSASMLIMYSYLLFPSAVFVLNSICS
jgi:hypothetical protein